MLRSWLRSHALFLTALVLGIAIRGVVIFAYRPALLFPDSNAYLRRAYDGHLSPLRPVGYSFFLRPIVLLTDSLSVIQLIHHAIAIVLVVACYALLRRRGLPGWGATLAVVPLLFDPLQLVLEHYILSDLLFEALLVMACVFLLWRHRPGYVEVVAAGLLVSASGLVRGAGSFLVVAFLIAVVALRLHWTKVVAFLVAAVLPMGIYAMAFHQQYGEYALAKAGPRFLYARIAPFVDCKDPQLTLRDYQRMLCPSQPPSERHDTDWYMWGRRQGPQYQLVPPPGMSREQVLKDFDKRVIRSQPVRYTKAVLKDFAGGFAPTRTYQVPGYPSRYWLFEDHYWTFDPFIERGYVSPNKLKTVDDNPAAAQFMKTYRTWVYLPGPVSAGLLLLAVVATLGFGRSRRSGDRVAIGLMAGSCALTLATGAALSGMSWRYQMPQIPLIPMAGALAIAALVRGRAAGQPEPTRPLRVLDRAAQLVSRAPMPAALRRAVARAAERGSLQAVIAVVAGLVVALMFGKVAVGSGWMFPGPAAVVGAGVALVVAVMLLVARARARADYPDDEPGPAEPTPEEPAEHAGAGR